MNTKDILKQYNSIIILAIIIIFIYKVFDVSIISTIFTAFVPVIIGGVLAYFLQPLVTALENSLERGNGFLKKHVHTISCLTVFLLFVLVIVLVVCIAMPNIINWVVDFSKDISSYTVDFENSIKEIFPNKGIANAIINIERKSIDYVINFVQSDPSKLVSYASKTGSTLITILLSLIFCPYILIEAKRLANIFDRIMLLFISKENLQLIHEYTYKSHRIFGSFIYGKFIDSVIIGIIALIGLGILDIRFFPLLALIVLITNMIPYFGPFIGGIPVVFVAVITNGFVSGLFSALFIFALQQFDGLILGPKILGDSVGISPFWIIFSITVFGSLFGFIGMFLGVPLICVIRMFFNDVIEYQKNKKRDVPSS